MNFHVIRKKPSWGQKEWRRNEVALYIGHLKPRRSTRVNGRTAAQEIGGVFRTGCPLWAIDPAQMGGAQQFYS
jgi:hypothetical protein